MSIDVFCDYVLINGARVDRPRRVSRLHWLEYWEAIARHTIGEVVRLLEDEDE